MGGTRYRVAVPVGISSAWTVGMSGMWKRSKARIMRHRQPKGSETARPDLTYRAPHLDSTDLKPAIFDIARKSTPARERIAARRRLLLEHGLYLSAQAIKPRRISATPSAIQMRVPAGSAIMGSSSSARRGSAPHPPCLPRRPAPRPGNSI